ncbi:MAG: hypothetical protein EOQ71_19620 [Mesorhizobium sp.]|nr:MAG: hypothetical protein EOQ71_19620 [Mesorhizobium sp.]
MPEAVFTWTLTSEPAAAVAAAAAANAVLAICALFVPAAAVGAVGTPLSAGLTSVLLESDCAEDRSVTIVVSIANCVPARTRPLPAV